MSSPLVVEGSAQVFLLPPPYSLTTELHQGKWFWLWICTHNWRSLNAGIESNRVFQEFLGHFTREHISVFQDLLGPSNFEH